MTGPERPQTAPRPLFGRHPLPLFTGSEAADFDRRAIESLGVPAPVLMENAGRSAALVLHHLHPQGPVRVLAGPGNNGGDGMVLARTLHAAGRDVQVGIAGSRPDPDPLLHGHSVPLRTLAPDGEGGAGVLREFLAGAGVIVDALLGTGVRGPLRPPFDRIVGALSAAREHGTPVFALDLPTGIDADTGRAGEGLAGADTTVTFGAPKVGVLLHPGRGLAGRLVAVEIGFPPWEGDGTGAMIVTPEWAAGIRPRRAARGHKNSEGRLLLIGGGAGMAGALVMSARAALRAGVGYLRIAGHPEHRDLLHATVPEAVVVDDLEGEALVDAARSSDAIAAGPGMGRGRMADALEVALGSLPEDAGVLLDADALTLLAGGGLSGFRDGPWPAERRLLTPHPGEAERLLERPSAELVADPLGAARKGAGRWSAAFLLKGNPSVVASGDGPVRVGLTGSSEFARAGMGDVLTGVAGTLLARGLEAADAGALALHWTGRAADHLRLGDALLPTDLGRALPAAMAEEGPGTTDLPFPFVRLDLPRAR